MINFIIIVLIIKLWSLQSPDPRQTECLCKIFDESVPPHYHQKHQIMENLLEESSSEVQKTINAKAP